MTKSISYDEFRNLIAQRLRDKETSLHKIANQCDNVSHMTIARFAHGESELTGPKIIELARAFGVRVILK